MELFPGIHAYIWGPAFSDSSNTYIIQDAECLIIDPGSFKSFTNLFGLMKNDGIDISDVDLILNTHLHKDHCESNTMFMRRGALLTFHEDEVKTSQFSFKPDRKLERTLSLGREEVEIVHLPGHTPGSVAVFIPEHSALITGDLIFETGMPGRVDMYGGDAEEMIRSLEKARSFDVNYILPGHGRILEGRKGISALFDKAIHILSRY